MRFISKNISTYITKLPGIVDCYPNSYFPSYDYFRNFNQKYYLVGAFEWLSTLFALKIRKISKKVKETTQIETSVNYILYNNMYLFTTFT